MASLFDLLSDTKETSSKSIVSSLFGLPPDLVAQQQAMSNLQNSQQTALQYAQMDPMQRAQYAMFQGASGATGGLMSAFGPKSAAVQRAENEALFQQELKKRGISLNNVQGYAAAAQLAPEFGLGDLVPKLGMAAVQLDKEIATAEKARRISPEDQRATAIWEQAIKEAGGDKAKAAQNLEDKEYRMDIQKRVAGRTSIVVTPDSGKVKPSDIQTTINTKKDVLGDTGDILDNIGIARAALQGANINPTSANQSYKSVAMVLKDKLLSNKDVRESLGKRGLLGRAEQTVESLMSGTLSPKVIKDANSYLNDIEKVIAPKYNKKVADFNALVDESNYSQQTRQSLYASPYEAAAPKSGLKEGQTGTSRSGRPMVVKNGKWEYQ